MCEEGSVRAWGRSLSGSVCNVASGRIVPVSEGLLGTPV